MKLTYRNKLYILESEYEDRYKPKAARFRFSYDGEDTGGIKKVWWTDDPEKAFKLIAHADAKCTRRIKTQLKTLDKKLEASKATDSDIDIPVNPGMAYMPFQRGGIAYALNHDNVLIADEMGLGKTIQAIGVMNALRPGNVLIICPASLKINWSREIVKWQTTTDEEPIILNSSDQPEFSGGTVICNYDIVQKQEWLKDIDWDILIVDECHYVKNHKAQRTKAVSELRAGKKLYLTGTPILNRPIELYSILNQLDVRLKWWDYVHRYCGAYRNRWGWDLSGATNLDELQRLLRSRVMVRRLKKDVLQDLPDKTRHILELPANGIANRVAFEQSYINAHTEELNLLKAQRDLAEANEDQDAYELAVENLAAHERAHFVEMAKIRHETALLKCPKVIDHIHELLESMDKLVVFAHHHDVADQIAAAFPSVKLTGRDDLEARQRAVDTFQEDPEIRVFVGNIKAAGVGITLTAASHVVFAELDWTPANISQAEDRCHRIGQKDNVTVQHIVLEGSIDADLAKTIVAKQRIIDKALNNDLQRDYSKAGKRVEETKKRASTPQKTPEFTNAERIVIHKAVKLLAAMCDGARELDGSGYNKFDSPIGHSFARQRNLTDKQTALAKKVLKKYHGQLDSELYTEIYGEK